MYRSVMARLFDISRFAMRNKGRVKQAKGSEVIGRVRVQG